MTRDEQEERPLSPSSQIGRQQQTGGTPESGRRPAETGDDADEWREPVEEDEPVERVRKAGS
jgi:hypothetical protein